MQKEGQVLEKHRCNIRFHEGKIVCASEILCRDCPTKKDCEDVDIFIEDKFENSKDCMSHDSHKRKNRRIKQKGWGK